MQNELLTVFLAFIEGLGLIISPCILPILPIVLSTSLTGSRQRPFGIIVGFVIVFSLFTLFSRALVQLSGINLDVVREISYGLLILLGLILFSTKLSEKFFLFTGRLASVGTSSKAINNAEGGFASGLLLGGVIALVWTPCAGPILAAVIVQSVLQTTTLYSFLVIFAFGLGAGIPMLIIALFGRNILLRLTFVKAHTELLRKILGLIIIFSVLFLIYNERYANLTTNPNPNLPITSINKNELINGINPTPAPDFTGITAWINSPPLTISQLKGKVVLIDFWTYSCINCIRTLPYLKNWYNKYRDKGLVIIGVHTPEFEFEKNLQNVQDAVKRFGILYPVALDSNYGTWQNYNNHYWPAHYLINQNGDVVYQHFGEGEYDVTENNIRFLLGLNRITAPAVYSENIADMFVRQTPETYLGYERSNVYTRPDNIVKDTVGSYSYPEHIGLNMWALTGKWIINREDIISADANAGLKLRFHAKDVYLVMGNKTGKPINVMVKYNGNIIMQHQGNDVVNGKISVTGNRLYHALAFDQPVDGVIELIAEAPGVEVYTFTFGS